MKNIFALADLVINAEKITAAFNNQYTKTISRLVQVIQLAEEQHDTGIITSREEKI